MYCNLAAVQCGSHLVRQVSQPQEAGHSGLNDTGRREEKHEPDIPSEEQCILGMEGDGVYRQESAPREYIRYSVIVWKMIVFVCAHTIQHSCGGLFDLQPLHGFWGWNSGL